MKKTKNCILYIYSNNGKNAQVVLILYLDFFEHQKKKFNQEFFD